MQLSASIADSEPQPQGAICATMTTRQQIARHIPLIY